MMKKLFLVFAAAIASAFQALVDAVAPREMVAPGLSIRMRTRDIAFNFRMGAGFAGDVNRTHPASIEPCLIHAAAPPTAYGQAVLVDATTQGVRPIVAGDSAVTAIYGVTVRPYPAQQSAGGMTSAFGSVTPPASGVIDVAKEAYIMVKLPAGGAPKKDGLVYVWFAVAAGLHVQGSFEAAATGGSTLLVSNARFNGSPDADGNVEIVVRLV